MHNQEGKSQEQALQGALNGHTFQIPQAPVRQSLLRLRKNHNPSMIILIKNNL